MLVRLWNPPRRRELSHGQRRIVYKDSKTVFVGLNGGRDKTYIMRAVVENLTAYGQGKMPKTVGYTQHIPANQVHKRRDEVSERIDQLNNPLNCLPAAQEDWTDLQTHGYDWMERSDPRHGGSRRTGVTVA